MDEIDTDNNKNATIQVKTNFIQINRSKSIGQLQEMDQRIFQCRNVIFLSRIRRS
jgi:hypothetical protein